MNEGWDRSFESDRKGMRLSITWAWLSLHGSRGPEALLM